MEGGEVKERDGKERGEGNWGEEMRLE